MNLDVGRLQAREVVQLGSLTIASLFVGCLGAYLAYLVVPAYGAWSGWRVLLAGFGCAVALLGGGCAVTVARLTYRDWMNYQRRLEEWHLAALDSYEMSGGMHVETSTTEWELTAAKPLHVLAIALSIHARQQAGEREAHSVRQLSGACWIGGVRMGDVTPGQAERLGRVLADLGLVEGRGPRRAGAWVPDSADQVLKLVEQNWRRVNNRSEYQTE